MGRGATQRREQARQEMRENILQAAREMIATEGLASLSLRGIARSLGYSPAALYEYFPSKEAIARALYFEGAEGLAGRMERALAALPPDTSPMEAKKALGRAYRQYALGNTELFLLVFGSGDTFGKLSEQFEQSESGYGPLIDVVRKGVEIGEFANLPPEAMAFTSWAGVHGFVMLELGCLFEEKQGKNDPKVPEGLSTDDLFELHMDLIDLGLRRR